MSHDFYSVLRSLPRRFPGILNLPANVIYAAGCRDFNQFCCTVRAIIRPEEFCPFCEREFTRRGRRIDFEVGGWKLFENEFPNASTERMWLAVPARHCSVSDLTGNDGGLFEVLAYARHHLGLESGGLFMRYGDPQYHVGTIPHVHVNLIVPKPGIPYAALLAKSEEASEADHVRVLAFLDEIEARGGESWLFSPEGVVATQPAMF